MTNRHAAIRETIALLERASTEEPPSYWRSIDELLAFWWDPEIVCWVNIAVGYIRALERGTDETGDP